MDNAWVVPIFNLILVYAAAGVILFFFWAMTEFFCRPARRYWQLPPKTWTLLAAGFIMQAICFLILISAIYVSFLPQSFRLLYVVLLALEIAGVGLSSAVLVLWLALVIRAQRNISPLEAIYGQDRKNRKLVIIITAAFPFMVVGQVGGPEHSWPLGIFVAIPATLYMLCIASLIAHSSEELTKRTM
ncbi:MAG TPA: hypothetical protein VFU63_01750 [Ktedonobacterales bacterium]|nr:hypothetical protein [Ktedonobacterales bacterium]